MPAEGGQVGGHLLRAGLADVEAGADGADRWDAVYFEVVGECLGRLYLEGVEAGYRRGYVPCLGYGAGYAWRPNDDHHEEFAQADQGDCGPGRDDGADWPVSEAVDDVRREGGSDAEAEQPASARRPGCADMRRTGAKA